MTKNSPLHPKGAEESYGDRHKKWIKIPQIGRKEQKKATEIDTKKWIKIPQIGYLHPKQKKATEIDTKKWIKIPQIGYLHPKGAEEGCVDQHQKMAKKIPNWLFTTEKSKRRLDKSTPKNG